MFDFLHELLVQCGWPGLVGVCIVGAIYFLINRSINLSVDKTADKMGDIIANQNTVLVKSMIDMTKQNQTELLTLLNKSLDSHDENKIKNHQASIQHRLDISESIQKHLYDLMMLYRSRRCALLEFHNSKENLNGLSFLWYDAHYEVKQRNVTPISGKCKDMQISNLMPIIKGVIENNGIIHYSPTLLNGLEKYSGVLYDQLVKELEATDIIFAGLYDSNNNIIGLVFLEYNDSIYKYDEEIMNFEDIKHRACTMSQLLEFK